MPAGEEAVRGDFADARFAQGTHEARFFRQGEAFWLEFALGDEPPQRLQVRYTFGVDPLQQYLVQQPGGRLQAMPFAWDTRPAAAGGQRWLMLYPDARPGDEFYWTGPGQNWNYMCADCHSTGVRKNYSSATDAYTTAWAELNVACEACHGPAGTHVAWARADERGEPLSNSGFPVDLKPGVAAWRRAEGEATAQPAREGDSRQLEVCAQCHSRRQQLSDAPAHSTGAFLNRHRLTLLETDRYWPDGQLFDETYVYGSFLQSRMYERGVECSHCHEPHSARLRAPADQVCARCHSPAVFATQAHHLHSPGSEGAACGACHMPETLYMQVDWRADHSLRVPRPDLSDVLGTPNPCTTCHAGRSNAWAANVLRQRFPDSARWGAESFAPVFAATDRGRVGLERELSYVAQNAAYSDFVRASALSRMSGYPAPDTLLAMARAARDGTPLQRLGVAAGATGLPTDRAWELLRPLLDDALLAVRTSAAGALAVRWPELTAAQRKRLQPALDEYLDVQAFNADRAYARSNIAGVRAAQGDTQAAVEAYRAALRLEPQFAPAWINLADVLRATGDEEEAYQALQTGVRRVPESAEVKFALGLADIRAGREAAARKHLAAAAEGAVDNAYFWYVYGLAQESVDLQQSLASIRKAYRISRDPQYLYSVCELSVRNRDPEASACLQELEGRMPPAAIQRLRDMQAGPRR